MPEYIIALYDLFAHLGARGISVLMAGGSKSVGAGDCEDAEENVQFIPDFPLSCTYGVYHPFHVPDKRKHKVLTRLPWFRWPLAALVASSPRSRRASGGFSTRIPPPRYQFDGRIPLGPRRRLCRAVGRYRGSAPLTTPSLAPLLSRRSAFTVIALARVGRRKASSALWSTRGRAEPREANSRS